jgi:Transglycosylase-like domain
MQIVQPTRKLLAPFIAALLICTQSTAWAVGSFTVRPPTIRPVRVVVPRAPTLARVTTPIRVAAPRSASPILRAPTKFPAGETTSSGFGIWNCIAEHESGDNWHLNDGSGFYGGLQFMQSTWESAGGLRFAPRADLATPMQQVEIARSWLAKTSWNQWPQTSRMCGV